MSVDSTFPLGAAVSAILISKGFNPYLALPVALAAGAVAGLVTGLIHVKCGVRDLLSGIITMTVLYSINLHIAGNKANVPIFSNENIFSLSPFKGILGDYNTVVIILIFAVLVKLLLDLFLKTKAGYILRAAGDNPKLVTTLAKDCGTVKILGLMIANGLVALSGSIMCQQQRFFDISMGTGTIVIGLASVIIGTNLFKKLTFVKATTAVLVGSIIYKACVAIAITLGLPANDMKLITGLLFLAILVIGNIQRRSSRNDKTQ
jgi:putative ABC transport system permease protein